MKIISKFLISLVIVTSVLGTYGIQQSTKVLAANTHTLTVQPSTDQTGQDLSLATITSSPAGINCGQGNTQCSAQFEAGVNVRLTATVFDSRNDIEFQWHPVNSYFHGSPIFSVPYMHCAGSNEMGHIEGRTCTALMPDSDVPIHFSAAYTHSTLTVAKSGTGTGIVANQNPVKPPLLINCGTQCVADIDSSLILFAIPDPGSVFIGWNINGNSSDQCGPTNYEPKCLTSYQENVRGDGGSDTFVAIFNKASSSTINQQPNNVAPSAPIAEVKSNNKLIAATNKPNLNLDDSLVLSGKTIVGGIVKIYVFSEPVTYTTVANKDGNWAFTLPLKNLAAGYHHIEADVTDPNTNKTSPRSQFLEFKTVNIAGPFAATSEAQPNKSTLFFVLTGLAIIILCTILIIIYLVKMYRNKRQSSINPESFDAMNSKKRL